MKIIFVVAADLDRTPPPERRVIVGPETRIVCDRAIELIRTKIGETIVITAGNAPPRWNNVWMADVMRSYIAVKAPYAPVEIRKASMFNTWGEMEKLAEFCSGNGVHGVILAARRWHMPRAYALCRYWLNRRHVSISIERSPCPSNASWRARTKELFWSRPKGLWRRLCVPLT